MANTRARWIVSTIAMLTAALAVSGCTLVFRMTARQQTSTAPSPQAGNVALFSSDVVVYQPLSNDEVKETFTVSGRAVDGITSVTISIDDSLAVPFVTSTIS